MFRTLEQVIAFYKRNLVRSIERLEAYDLKNASEKYSVWGGVEIGRLQQKICDYEDFIYDLEQIKSGEIEIEVLTK